LRGCMMGKIYKNPTPKARNHFPKIKTQVPTPFILPEALVLPLEQFDSVLQEALLLVQKQQFQQALPLLLNLEITNFEHIEVHELLADIFLNLNQIDLAKEQCQIYAQLLQKSQESDLLPLKSFDQLLDEAGDYQELQESFKEFQNQDSTLENFYQGTNIALKLATHLMASKHYQEAEQLLTHHREQYIHFLEQDEQS
ncbi:MAG: tetratricopeptide repeat protein, partial [Brevinema sp.]